MSVRAPQDRARAPLAKYVVTYPAGAKIYGEGEIGTEMYAIRSGEVEITKTVAGETCVLGVVPRGEFFGEVSLLEDAPREAGARARTEAVLIRINSTVLETMLKRSPEIAVRMMRMLSRRAREAEGGRTGGRQRPRRDPAIPVSSWRPSSSPSSSPTPGPGVGRLAVEPFADSRVELCMLLSEDRETQFPIREGDTIIGRDDPVAGSTADVDLAALDPKRSVSRRHARVYRIGDTDYLMEEIGVVNGTFVNDTRLATGIPVALCHGDLVRFGLVTLIFWKPA
jgi:Cyclic nucleotide-binding domain/FHA domain